MKILVFTTDMIPFRAHPTSGTALRTFGLINGLKESGAEVIISVPKNAINSFKKTIRKEELDDKDLNEIKELELLSFNSFNQSEIISKINPDCILCGHWPAMMLHTKPKVPLIIDLAGPHLLERHFQGEEDFKGVTLAKLKSILMGDYFIVSGERQRLYFLSFLLRLGVRDAEKKIFSILMPLNPALPTKKESKEYPNFIFGGVFLPWQDPSWCLLETLKILNKKDSGKMTLIGGAHPNYDINKGKYETIFKTLESDKRVSRKKMIPYDDFIKELTTSDVALDVMKWNIERQLAVTIRTTTYLWSGVPVIYNDYSDLSNLILKYDAGWLVPHQDNKALEKVIDEIINSKEIVKEKSKNAFLLAKNEFSWDKAVKPLINLLSKPESSPLRETDIIIERTESADFSIYKKHFLTQYFLSRIDGLTRIECKIATHDRKVSKDLEVSLYLVDLNSYKPSTRELLEAKTSLITKKLINPSNLVNNEWIGIDFDAIKKSSSKIFMLSLSSKEENKENSVSPWAMKASPYPLFSLYYKDLLVKNMCLCIRTISQNALNF